MVATAAGCDRVPQEVFRDLRAGAESGWDFSSRWIRPVNDQFNLSNIYTNEVVPVDLNAILYKCELNLAYFASILSGWSGDAGDTYSRDGYADQSAAWKDVAELRGDAINALLWDAQHKHWRDFNLTSQTWTHYTAEDAQFAAESAAVKAGTSTAAAAAAAVKASTSALRSSATHTGAHTTPAAAAAPSYATIAYWIPMWATLSPPDSTTSDELVSSLQASGLLQVAGVLTTTVSTGQQWDSPEAWAPLVMFTIEGLQNLNTANSLSLAVRIEWMFPFSSH